MFVLAPITRIHMYSLHPVITYGHFILIRTYVLYIYVYVCTNTYMQYLDQEEMLVDRDWRGLLAPRLSPWTAPGEYPHALIDGPLPHSSKLSHELGNSHDHQVEEEHVHGQNTE